MPRNNPAFARKHEIAVALVLMVAISACSFPGEPAGKQNVAVASIEPEAEPELSAESGSFEAVEPDPMIILPDLGPAPDITNEIWLNSDTPLDLEAVRGRVVLVEFWTFG